MKVDAVFYVLYHRPIGTKVAEITLQRGDVARTYTLNRKQVRKVVSWLSGYLQENKDIRLRPTTMGWFFIR